MAIEAVLFDLGNVLIEIEFRKMLRALGVNASDEAHAWERVLTWEPYDLFERGVMTKPGFFLALNEFLGKPQEFERLERGMNEIFVREVPRMAEAIQAIRERRLPVFVLSNINPVHYEYCQANFSIMKLVDQFFLSYEMGCRKPERKIYEQVVRDTRLRPDQILFFDDVQKNVDVASAVGLKAAHCYRDAELVAKLVSNEHAQRGR